MLSRLQLILLTAKEEKKEKEQLLDWKIKLFFANWYNEEILTP